MSQSPKYSFIIPAYNVEAYILETVNSVLSDPRKDIEVIVVNDGSTDNTRNILESIFDDRIKIMNKENGGVSSARNLGLKNSNGEYIILLDGDDIYEIENIDKLSAPFETDKEVALTYANYIKITADGKNMRASPYGRIIDKPSGDVLERILRKNFICVGTCCFKAKDFKKNGYFNENLTMSEDWEYWCRLACEGKFAFVPGFNIFKYRQYNISASSVQATNIESFLPAINSVFSYPKIKSRFSKKKLEKLRNSRLSHVNIMIACNSIKSGQHVVAIKWLLKAIYQCPSRAPEFIARYLVAML